MSAAQDITPESDIDGSVPVPDNVLDVEIEETEDSADEDVPTATQALRYHGVDFDVEGLVRRLRGGELVVPNFDPDGTSETGYEGFQRGFVWPRRQMDRFIESLLLGYPVPGLFLVELPNRSYMVMDGQQRLRTLRDFYVGKTADASGKPQIYSLKYAGPDFNGLTYDELDPADRRLLDNTFISATIVTPRGDDGRGAVYTLFERINSSGMKLQPQEIRVALFAGPLMHFLRDLNDQPGWRRMFGRKHSRLRDHELILRFLSLREHALIVRKFGWDTERAKVELGEHPDANALYRPAMNSFLNRFLDRHEGLRNLDVAHLTDIFSEATTLLAEVAGPRALRPSGTSQVNSAHSDAVLVGLALVIEDQGLPTPEAVTAALSQVEEDEEYERAISGSTSHTGSVETRLRIAADYFAESHR